MVAAAPVKAGTMWVFEGTCDAYTKEGEQREDLTQKPGEPIPCDLGTVNELDNGSKLIQVFKKSATRPPLGFAGLGFDTKMNKKLMIMTIHRVYITPGKPVAAEGLCFFNGHAMSKTDGFGCSSMVQEGARKKVFKVQFHATAVAVRHNLQ
jgi:hypothetical protein